MSLKFSRRKLLALLPTLPFLTLGNPKPKNNYITLRDEKDYALGHLNSFGSIYTNNRFQINILLNADIDLIKAVLDGLIIDYKTARFLSTTGYPLSSRPATYFLLVDGVSVTIFNGYGELKSGIGLDTELSIISDKIEINYERSQYDF